MFVACLRRVILSRNTHGKTVKSLTEVDKKLMRSSKIENRNFYINYFFSTVAFINHKCRIK